MRGPRKAGAELGGVLQSCRSAVGSYRVSDWSGVGFGPASGNTDIIPYFSLTLSQSVRPLRRARRAPVKGTRCSSRGLRPGAAYRQRGGRRRHFRDYCQRPRKKRTHCCRDARPSSAAALPELRGGVRGVHHSPSSWRASGPPRSASLSTLSLLQLTRGSLRPLPRGLSARPLCTPAVRQPRSPSVPSGGRGGGVCSHPRDHMVTLGSQCSGR